MTDHKHCLVCLTDGPADAHTCANCGNADFAPIAPSDEPADPSEAELEALTAPQPKASRHTRGNR